MIRLRLATCAMVAGLGLVSGCRSLCNPCDPCASPCNGNGGMISRLLSRRNGGTVVGTPVSGMPLGMGDCCGMDGCCDGGPMLGDPTLINGGMVMPPYNGAPYNGMPPPGVAPPMGTIPPMSTLPAPTTAPPPLAPVPVAPSPGLATPTPAQPSGRWWR
jgi:hypothetical protein